MERRELVQQKVMGQMPKERERQTRRQRQGKKKTQSKDKRKRERRIHKILDFIGFRSVSLSVPLFSGYKWAD